MKKNRSKMKNIGVIVSVFSIAVLLSSLSPIVAMAAPTASIEPNTQVVEAGESFTFGVRFNPDVNGLTGGSVTIEFNASVMEVNSAADGDLFTSYYKPPGYPKIDNTNGTVIFEAVSATGAISPPAPAGNFTVITATVNADAPSGVYNLNITKAEFGDELGNPIPGIVVYNGTFIIPAGPDTTPPTVTVTSPNGGENWPVGTSQTITWTASDNSGVVTSIDIYYSTNGGATYPYTIATGETNDGAYTWTVPNTPSTTCRVKVVAHDAAGNIGEDESDADFTIVGAPIVMITISNTSISPNNDSVKDDTSIDVVFSENVNYTIAIEKAGATVYDWTGVNTKSASVIWNGTNKTTGSVVSDGTYTVNVSATSVTTGLSVTNTTKTITVDTVAPTISNVASSSVTSSTATITWTTNEDADSVVNYGTTTGLGSTKLCATLTKSHSIVLSGLTANTKYYYEVRSTDDAGNEAVDNNTGNFYTFTTATAARPPRGGGGAAAPAVAAGVTSLSTEPTTGEVKASVTAKSADAKAAATITAGTIAKDAAGKPLAKVTITPPSVLPAAPPATVSYVGYAYNFGPEGATFEPAIEISIEFDPAKFEGKTPVIYTYEAGNWVRLDTRIEDNKAIAKVDHFSTFVLFGEEVPPTPTPTPAVTPTATPTATPSPTPSPTPTPTPKPGIPGYEAVFAIAGLLAVAYLVLRRNRK